jgi:hypothetical protein
LITEARGPAARNDWKDSTAARRSKPRDGESGKWAIKLI